MSERICFHLDENTNPAIARALRQQGIDVTTTADVELLGQPDEVYTPEEMNGRVEYL